MPGTGRGFQHPESAPGDLPGLRSVVGRRLPPWASASAAEYRSTGNRQKGAGQNPALPCAKPQPRRVDDGQ